MSGVVVAGSPHAVQCGAAVLRRGGNATDAAVGAALAMAVADPANNSFFGRCQILRRGADGRCTAVDGATQAPAGTPPRRREESAARGGFAAVPIPGLPRALALLHARFGRVPFAAVVAPAADLAARGFEPPRHLAGVWAARAGELAGDPGARRVYLGDAAPGVAPRMHRNPRLAGLLRHYGRGGADAVMTGQRAWRLAARVVERGGHWSAADLRGYAAREGEVIRGYFRDCEVTTVGRQGWGHSLIEMLSVLDTMPRFDARLDAGEAERLLLTILQALADRPQQIGTLTPRPDGLAYETLIEDDFARERARHIEALLAAPPEARQPPRFGITSVSPSEDQDTTHLSVVGVDGEAVAITCSIGPHFGARVAEPEHGVLLPHSYRMATDPTPAARDVTEMTPTVVTRDGELLLVLGAAGSERIPGAIAQVVVNVIDRGLPLDRAVAFPRVNVKDGQLRVHAHAGSAVAAALRRRGYDVFESDRDHGNHLGIVHAAARTDGGHLAGAADPAWDGDVAIV